MEKKTKILIIALSILGLATVITTILLITEKKANKELVQEFKLEKEELENEYTTFANQYDELKFQVSNDSLSSLLDKEQTKVQRLLEELRTVKTTNASEIRRLKKELSTLRKIMVGYINQIDSLNRLTAKQQTIIKEVNRKYKRASRRINHLSKEKESLNKKVELASQLDVTNIKITPRKKRNRVAKRIKDVLKFQIDFTIVKNITAQTGEKVVYLRIMKPDNSVLFKNSSDVFSYENKSQNYSIKKYVEYDGEEQSLRVYWDVDEFLYAGTYRFDIFADGNLIGSKQFTMKR